MRYRRIAPCQAGGGARERQYPFSRRPDWWPDWRGCTAVIVAGGPSAARVDLGQARGGADVRVLAINNGYKLAPWADVLYACDYDWWKAQAGAPEFKGLKVSQDGYAPDPAWGLHLVTLVRNCDRLLFNRFGELGWGGNGGFHALNLALQFGARRAVLVGYDMRVDLGVHWHGKHPAGMNNPSDVNTRRWRQVLDAQAPLLSEMGVEVLNASPVSALEAYPKMTLEAALGTALGMEELNAAA